MNTAAISSAQSSRRRAADRATREKRYWAWLAPASVRKTAVIEVVVGMAVLLALSYVLRPEDPLLMEIPFPWLWLAATLFALRYGTLPGVIAGMMIMMVWWGLYPPATLTNANLVLAGGMVQLVIVGHFSDLWSTRLQRLQEANTYLDDRLASVINHHYLLRVSHEHLEREMLARPVTLRDAVANVRALAQQDAVGQVLPGAQHLLDYAATLCRLDTAAIFAVNEGKVSETPVAHIGAEFSLNMIDPVLVSSMETNTLVHLRDVAQQEGAYLACVPIIAADKTCIGVLVVRGMSFLALNLDNLQLLLVLMNYYADGLAQSRLVKRVQQHAPDCPHDFALEVGRLTRMAQAGGMPSALLALKLPSQSTTDAVYDVLAQQRRTLDLVWHYEGADATVVIVLLPLTDRLGADGYLLRIQHALRRDLGDAFDSSTLETYCELVRPEAPGASLGRLLARSAHG